MLYHFCQFEVALVRFKMVSGPKFIEVLGFGNSSMNFETADVHFILGRAQKFIEVFENSNSTMNFCAPYARFKTQHTATDPLKQQFFHRSFSILRSFYEFKPSKICYRKSIQEFYHRSF